MDLRRIFAKDEYAEIERETRKEQAFQNRLSASVDRFKRRGAGLLAEGDLQALKEAFVACTVDAALGDLDSEWPVLDHMEKALLELIGRYDAELKSEFFEDL